MIMHAYAGPCAEHLPEVVQPTCGHLFPALQRGEQSGEQQLPSGLRSLWQQEVEREHHQGSLSIFNTVRLMAE